MADLPANGNAITPGGKDCALANAVGMIPLERCLFATLGTIPGARSNPAVPNALGVGDA